MTISNCGHDENGRYSGGRAGDQSGTEWYLRTWYNGSWQHVYRHPNAEVRALISQLAVEAAQNNLVGYDQGERGTFWEHLKASGYRPSKITVACEADCSSGVAGIVKAVGYLTGDARLQSVSQWMTTYSEHDILTAAGFEAFSASKYLTGESCLMAGDILRSSGHTVIEVSTGGNASASDRGTATASASYPCKGWTGTLVRKIQTALIAKGYSCGKSGVDGDFGKDTDAAVRKYQADNGLEVDGIVGPLTQGKLFTSESKASAYASGNYRTVVDCLNVRTGAGTDKARKTRSQLTADGQAHANSEGQLRGGTTVTVMEAVKVGSDCWGRIPSGWICLEWQGKPYVAKV